MAAGLVDKPWNTALAFVPGGEGHTILVGTGEHKLRLYDTRQRRPALQVEFGDTLVTALAPEPSGEQMGCPASSHVAA